MRAAELDEQQGCWIQDVPIKDYYSVQECSIILDVGSPSVYSAIKRGTMKGVRVNGVTHVRHSDLIAYINKRGTGRPRTNLADAVIEEITPKEDKEREAVEMQDEPVEVDVQEPDGSGDEGSPLDFLDE
jgi:hypothetical protein